MALRALQPLSPADFRDGDPFHHQFTFESGWDAHAVWAQLSGDSPLHWCSGIRRIRWTSPQPRGVGATRTAVTSDGMELNERFIVWAESEEELSNAFTVESSNSRLFRRFGEKYTVRPTAAGSQFVWEFSIEPRGPRFLGKAVRPVVARKIASFQADTIAFLGGPAPLA